MTPRSPSLRRAQRPCTRMRARAWHRAYAAVLAVATLAACERSGVAPLPNPVPIVEAIDPVLVDRSPDPTPIDVLGLGFAADAVARWNGEARPTTVHASERLTIELTPGDLLAGAGEIDVVNPEPGGGTSTALTLAVANPAPVLASISPTQAPAITTWEVTLEATGSDFVGGASVLWDGHPLPTTLVSPTQLQATVPDYLLRSGRSAAITVANPAPGGGESAPLFFGVENPVPVVTGVQPVGVPIGMHALLEVLGSGFVHGVTVWIGDTQLAPGSVSSTVLEVGVPGSLSANETSLSLRVENPGPGGGASNPVEVIVWQRPPVIDYLAPSRVFAGADDFTLFIHGSDFDSNATVTWNGDPRPALIQSSELIELAVAAADVATEGTIELVVGNPGADGEAHAEFAVLPPPSAGSTLLAESRTGNGLIVADIDGNPVVTIPVGGVRVDASPIDLSALYQAGRIFEVDPTTGLSRRVSSPEAEEIQDEQWAKYSADGQWIYFMGNNLGRWEIWRTPAAAGGASEPLIVNAQEDVGYPAPSHSGDRITYSLGVDFGGSRLWIYDLITKASTPLNVDAATSRWTPDDEWIVYWVWGGELRAIRPDGTDDFAIPVGVSVASGFDVSPDGNYIIAAEEGAGSDALLIEFPSGTVHRLPNLGPVGSMAWYGP